MTIPFAALFCQEILSKEQVPYQFAALESHQQQLFEGFGGLRKVIGVDSRIIEDSDAVDVRDGFAPCLPLPDKMLVVCQHIQRGFLAEVSRPDFLPLWSRWQHGNDFARRPAPGCY